MSGRAVPFYCPYCGEEDLRPAARSESVPEASWWCASCLRTFVVTLVGIGVPETAGRASMTAVANAAGPGVNGVRS